MVVLPFGYILLLKPAMFIKEAYKLWNLTLEMNAASYIFVSKNFQDVWFFWVFELEKYIFICVLFM
jgi:hypothetical protein